MKTLLLLCVVLGLACVNPVIDCRLLCGDGQPPCPFGYMCVPVDTTQSVCHLLNAPAACPLTDSGATAGPDAGPATPDVAAESAPDAPQPADAAADAPPGSSSDQLCIRPDRCLSLTPALRAGLVLWLDPTMLPVAGAPVPVWNDRSGMKNDALAVDPTLAPTATADGVQFHSTAFRVPHNASVDFGSDGFMALVVARMNRQPPSCFLTKHNDELGELARNVALDWSYALDRKLVTPTGHVDSIPIVSESPADLGDQTRHLVGLVRLPHGLQLRVDGVSVTREVPVPDGTSVANASDLFIGACDGSRFAPTIYEIDAVVLVRGAPAPEDLGLLEGFLMGSFAIAP